MATTTATIAITPVSTQTTETPFPVTGTYTLTPALQFSDDGGTTYTAIPAANVTPIGSVPITFTNPGMTSGSHTLTVSSSGYGAATAISYTVDSNGNISTFEICPAVATNTSLATILPSYAYEQYSDDDNIQALFGAYNKIAQSYMDWFNTICLPVYTGSQISGPLLDWVGAGLYGIVRPNLAYTTTAHGGALGTYDINTLPLNASVTRAASTLYVVTDDIYKRIITWNVYKGDGTVFNVLWLKRRILRFLAGVNGTDVVAADTRQISVQFSGTTTVIITINTGVVPTTYAPIFRAALIAGVLPLPFQYTFNIVLGS